jgi:hypothetical protein
MLKKLTAKATWKTLILSVACLCSGSGIAQIEPPWVSLLRQEKYAVLEAETKALQERFAAGKVSEIALGEAYRSFYGITTADLSLIDQWNILYPNSYGARLIRGTYYARALRGLAGSGQLDTTMLQGIATAELRESLKFTDKPYLSVLRLLEAEFNSPYAHKELLELGTNLLPSNILIRAEYLRGLSPSRGGSLKAMNKFVAESSKKGATQNGIKVLQSIVMDEMGDYYLKNGDETHAVEHFSKALQLNSKTGVEVMQEALHASHNSCRFPKLNSYCRRQVSCDADPTSICSPPADNKDTKCLNYGALAMGAWHRLDICLTYRDEVRNSVMSVREAISLKWTPSSRQT